MDTLDKILKLLKENNIEQKDFGAALGLSRSAVSSWKSGQTKSYLKYIYQIADYFGVSVEYLLSESDSEPTTSISALEYKDYSKMLYNSIRQLLISKGELEPGEPLPEEIKNICIDIFMQHLGTNYDQYKAHFIKDSWEK